MTIKLPKHLKGMVFDKIMPINMSAFDVDLLLPQLFFKAITQGKDYGRRPNDPTLIKQYIDDFSVHQDITGFGDEDGRRLLERVTRTALIYTGKRGQSQRGEQIMALKEYTLLAFKPGYPHVGSTLRRVDD
ncbi:MAG: hypothetical protein NTZ05_02225, partial [Chloroflexi bacterium]|nr:hypothetical protein [Chloroflexota bacterium]